MKTETDARKPERKFCMVLAWSFHMTGGVNQVINNLEHELISDPTYGLTPLALEMSWGSTIDTDVLPTGTRRFFVCLRPPFIPQKPLVSVFRFLTLLPQTLLRLRRFAREQNIAVFNVHFPGLEAANFVLLRMAGMFKGKIVLSMHGSDIRMAHQASAFEKVIWRWILRHSSAVVTCSNGLKEEVLMLEKRAPVVTIYNGIDMLRFKGATASSPLMAELAGKKVVVNVGGFEYRKGHDILLRAFERVREKRNDAVLLLVGKSGPVSAEVQDYIREAGLQSSVIVMEDVPHAGVYGLLAQSTVFVLSTRWQKKVMGEGFALAILEAAAAKLPVVATASCGVDELIQNDKTGIVVPLEDPAALAEAILRMLNEPESARGMANRLHALVRDQFTWQRATRQYANLVLPNGSEHQTEGQELSADEVLIR